MKIDDDELFFSPNIHVWFLGLGGQFLRPQVSWQFFAGGGIMEKTNKNTFFYIHR